MCAGGPRVEVTARGREDLERCIALDWLPCDKSTSGLVALLDDAPVGWSAVEPRTARALEGYPIDTTNVISEELLVGMVGVFAAAGFVEVSHPSKRRVVMRIEF